jgi:hypothetical protein
MKMLVGTELRKWAVEDTSQGQPDASRLQRARVFAREVINNVTIDRASVRTILENPHLVKNKVYA